MDIGNPTFRAPFGARQVHTEDRCILGLDKCIDICAEMNRHCSHCSTAKNCAVLAFVVGMQQMP
jgi:hypothetical protein